ncbi:MAG: hypothetical protein KME38_00825 [Spirirestis rafaelensis WJT71-NPBG6]|jgi:hypothetical protein|nr:hypothetical protein [Spirirestis rafaelensis WJT71-NPBG6]
MNFARIRKFSTVLAFLVSGGLSLSSSILPALAIPQQFNIVGGSLVFADSGRWVPFRWRDGGNMNVLHANAGTVNGTPVLVVVGGDGTLLYRVGNASRSSSFFLSGYAGSFRWGQPGQHRDGLMRAKAVDSVTPVGSNAVRISIIGGNGARCTLDAGIYDLDKADWRSWDCL